MVGLLKLDTVEIKLIPNVTLDLSQLVFAKAEN